MKHKLLIQRFAEGIDFAGITNALSLLTNLTEEIPTLIQEIATIANAVVGNSSSFTSAAQSSFQSILNDLQSSGTVSLSETLGNLSTFLTNVVNVYKDLNIDYSQEITNWTNSLTTALSSITGGLAATDVQKGSITGETYGSQVNSHISSISNSARNIITETAGLIGDTGKYYKSVTGSSIQQAAIGTVKTLFTSNGSSIIQKFVNAFLGNTQ